MRVNKRMFVVAAVCALAAGLIWLRDARRSFESIAPRPFDSAKWRSLDSLSEGEELLAMARDVVTRRLLVGKSRAEVLGLLGETSYERKPQNELRYALRDEFSGIDPIGGDYLVVVFDAGDRVIEVRHEEWHRR